MQVKKSISVKHIELTEQKKFIQNNFTFSDLVIDAHKKFSALDREFKDELFYTLRSTDYQTIDDGILVHLVKYEQDGKTATVPKGKDKSKDDKLPIDEIKAPKNSNFLQNDCFFYVYKNYILYINNGLNTSKVQDFLNSLLTKATLIDSHQKILLCDLADPNILAKIRKYGVKRLRMKSLIDSGTWKASKHLAASKSNLYKLHGNIFDLLKNYETSDGSESKLNFEITFNNKGVLEKIEKDPLTAATLGFYTENQEYASCDFYIELNGGNELIPDNKIKIKRDNEPINTKGNTLDLEHVGKVLKAYKDELVEKKFIDED